MEDLFAFLSREQKEDQSDGVYVNENDWDRQSNASLEFPDMAGKIPTREEKLTYLSLFSGIGGFECGIQEVFPNATCLGFSEIDPHACAVYEKHFPTHMSLGDITKVDFKQFRGKVDLVVGGSPCTDLSSARTAAKDKRKGLEGNHSRLFWEFVRCLQECKPKHFILENVNSMKTQDKDAISKVMKVSPVMLNSRNVTAQNRRRLFWANFPITEFEDPDHTYFRKQMCIQDADLVLSNILLPIEDVEELQHTAKLVDYVFTQEVKNTGKTRYEKYRMCNDSDDEKSKCVGAFMSSNCYNVLIDRRDNSKFPIIRKFSPIELERLQGFPDNWTSGLSYRQRCHAIGNAVTVPIIAFIMLQYP